MAVVRGRPSGLPVHGVNPPVCEPAHSCHPSVSQLNGGNSSSLRIITMTIQKPLHHYTKMSHPATDNPVLLIDANAPLRDLHACAAERLNAVLKYLDLMACIRLPDHAEHDINTVTNIAKIMVQDVSDVFRVIEQRGFDIT
jgi:hypothetical protein